LIRARFLSVFALQVRLRKELPDKQVTPTRSESSHCCSKLRSKVASSVAAFFDVSNFVGSWVGGNEGSEEERGEDVNVEVGGGGGHRGVAGVLVPPTSLDGLGMVQVTLAPAHCAPSSFSLSALLGRIWMWLTMLKCILTRKKWLGQ